MQCDFLAIIFLATRCHRIYRTAPGSTVCAILLHHRKVPISYVGFSSRWRLMLAHLMMSASKSQHHIIEPAIWETYNLIIYLIIIMKLLLVSQMLNAFYSRFKAIKKTELERIAAVVLKNCSVSLSSPLCQIFAMPLSLGQLLDQWKISEITPTY